MMATQDVTRRWFRLPKLERHEITWLLVGVGVCLLLWGFLALASEVTASRMLASFLDEGLANRFGAAPCVGFKLG